MRPVSWVLCAICTGLLRCLFQNEHHRGLVKLVSDQLVTEFGSAVVGKLLIKITLDQTSPKCGSCSQTTIGKVVSRAMQNGGIHSVSETQEASRLTLKEIGKVFAPRDEMASRNPLRSDQLLRYGSGKGSLGLRVDYHTVAPLIVDLDRGAVA